MQCRGYVLVFLWCWPELTWTECIGLIQKQLLFLSYGAFIRTLRRLDSHYQQTQYDRSEHKSCNSAGRLQTHLFLCAPDPMFEVTILMIRRSLSPPARPVEMLQYPIFRWSPGAFSSCASVTGFNVSRAHTVLHCAAHGSVWMGLLTGRAASLNGPGPAQNRGARVTAHTPGRYGSPRATSPNKSCSVLTVIANYTIRFTLCIHKEDEDEDERERHAHTHS